jgi:hypothetical protein
MNAGTLVDVAERGPTREERKAININNVIDGDELAAMRAAADASAPGAWYPGGGEGKGELRQFDTQRYVQRFNGSKVDDLPSIRFMALARAIVPRLVHCVLELTNAWRVERIAAAQWKRTAGELRDAFEADYECNGMLPSDVERTKEVIRRHWPNRGEEPGESPWPKAIEALDEIACWSIDFSPAVADHPGVVRSQIARDALRAIRGGTGRPDPKGLGRVM